MKKRLKGVKLVTILLYCFTVLSIILFSELLYYKNSIKVHAQEISTINAEHEETDSKEDISKNDLKKTPPQNLNSKGYDIVYVIDNSKSIWSQQEFRNQAFRNISNLAVGSDIRIGIVYFANDIYKKKSLTSMEKEEKSKKVMKFLNMKEQNIKNKDTNIGVALKEAADMFKDQNSSRERIVILFSDGINENDAQNAAYKRQANDKTKKQVARLKKQGVQIYCVYLQKSYNNEAYLKDLVNYFSKSNSYDSKRFFKVKKKEINTLSDKFADIFYAMQNNMKYHKIKLDSNGIVNFYVPSLGVEDMRIYLDGDIQKTTLYAEKESTYNSWKDGTATFINCANPTIGDWSMEVSSKKLNKVNGTIAYYAYLDASAELISTEISDNNSDKNKTYQLIIHFYDKDGKEISIDPQAEISTQVIFVDENKKKIKKKLIMSIEEGITKSEPFTFDFYGTYSYKVNLKYEDFIDLKYSLEGGTIEKMAPIVYNIASESFLGEKTKDGKIQFFLKESSVFKDPEKEKVEIKEVISLNTKNNIENVEQKDGYIYITAQKTGDINFALQLEDASGMTAEVTIQGVLKDVGTKRMINRSIVIIVGVIIVFIIFIVCNRWRLKEKLKKQLIRLEQRKEDCNFQIANYRKEWNYFLDNKASMELALYSNDEPKGILALANTLTSEQREDFQINKYLEENYGKDMIAKANGIKNAVDTIKRSINIYTEQVGGVKENKGNLKSDNQTVKGCSLGIEKELYKLIESNQKLHEYNNELLQQIKEMGNTAGMIEEMLETEIKCNLVISDISVMPDIAGKYSCQHFTGKYIRGFYKLDDIKVLKYGRLSQNIGNTGIYIYGYEDETGNIGLELRSTKDFSYKIKGDSNVITGKYAKLLKGKCYEFTIQTNYQEVSMVINVQ